MLDALILYPEATLYCRTCGNTNPAYAHFCIKCGSGLRPESCMSCGATLLPNANFCMSCGRAATRIAPGPAQESAGAAVAAGRWAPFTDVKARALLIMAVLATPVTITLWLGLAALTGAERDDPTVVAATVGQWVNLTLFFWIFCAVKSKRVSLRRLMGRVPPGFNWLSTIALIFAAIVFAAGMAIVAIFVLSLAFPDLARAATQDSLLGETANTRTPILYGIVLGLSLMVAAPLLEELAFRGLLLHRWTVKWGVRKALFVSTIIFGLAHLLNAPGAAFGATMAGFILAILYIKTRTLIVPMVCHFIFNGFAFSVSVISAFTDPPTAEEAGLALEQIRDAAGTGALLIAISLPFLLNFVIRNWPRATDLPPYFEAAPAAPGPEPVIAAATAPHDDDSTGATRRE